MRYYSRDAMTFDVSDSHDGLDTAGADVVVLLHGWPQDHRTWDAVSPLLVAAGLRTIAPDLRGYSPGARPPRVADYVMGELVGDVLALVDELGCERVHLVGHDWGGALAWAIASRHPDRLASLTVVSTPHPAAMVWAFRHGDQARRSWYMPVLAIPGAPAAVLRRAAGPILRRAGLPPALASQYAERLARPGAAAATLRWYQAANPLRPMAAQLRARVTGRCLPAPERPTRPRSVVPTTYVWGAHDPVFGRPAAERTEVVLRRAAEAAGADPDSVTAFVEVDGGHWIPETHPGEVAGAVLALRDARVRRSPSAAASTAPRRPPGSGDDHVAP